MRDNNRTLKSDTFEGELMSFIRVDRRYLGAYLCIAKNEVPPAVSKRVFLNVNCKIFAGMSMKYPCRWGGKARRPILIIFLLVFFPPPTTFASRRLLSAVAPNVTIMNEKSVHVLERTNVEIECTIEASPRPVSYWIKEPLGRSAHQSADNPGQNVLQEGDKYAISESVQSHYKTKLRMRISSFDESDVGVYTCIASNLLGRANSTIRLYGEFKSPSSCSRFSRCGFLPREELWKRHLMAKRFGD
jgi:neurotrimin